MSENEATSDQDDVSFIRTDDMVCLQCSETGERVCLAAEGFGNRHCFLEPIANKNYPPEMPSCVFVIEQALSVRALQEMVTAESNDLKQSQAAAAAAAAAELTSGADQSGEQLAADEQVGPGDSAASAPSSSGSGSGGGVVGGVGGGGNGGGGGGGGSGGVLDNAPARQLSAIQLTKGGESGAVGGGNRTLLYGHAVLLRHFHSSMYLATLPICSSSDKLAFDVGLKDAKEHLGESCWWTVHPGSKQRSEGEKVRFGDDLILVSVATERYLHFTTISSDHPLAPPPMASASAAATACAMAGKQAIVNASFHSTHWSIAPFGTGLSRVKNVGYVFGGQVLRLLHGGDECLTVSAQATGEQQQQQQQQAQLQQQISSNNEQQQQASSIKVHHHQQQLDVLYEGGAVINQARSLWRLDLIRTRWSGGFVQYSNALRIRHITTGKYLGVNEQQQLCLLAKVDATVERTAFCLRLTKDDSKSGKGAAMEQGDEKEEEVIGAPMIKYGDSSFFIQHIESQMWLSYRSYETKKRGIGRVEEKQAILSAEGKMDDCLEFSRSQDEEAKTARVIRKCDALFSKFIKILDYVQQVAAATSSGELDFEQVANTLMQGSEHIHGLEDRRPSAAAAAAAAAAASSSSSAQKKRGSVATSAVVAAAALSMAPLFPVGTQHQQQLQQSTGQEQQSGRASPVGGQQAQAQLDASSSSFSLFPYQSQIEMSKCLEDLIDYFAPPEEGCDHEQEQNRLRALRNRQDLFQEEGILNLILDAIDKINLISGQGLLVLLLGEESSSLWESITGYFYQLLAAIIKDNHTNCAQFAQSHRLNWLFSRLSSQQASEGTGMLDVLHCVLVDSPEALNMLKESHIKVLISLLEKHGRDPKVLNVLCSLCVSNGVAIRSSQNTITNHLLPGRNLLLQTRLIDEVASMRPNIFVARVDGSAMYHRWYYEVIVDHIELSNSMSPHLRIGWANTKGYTPYPGGGSCWGANGAGDDFYSYSFDGQYLWTAGRPTLVRLPPNSTMTRQEQLKNQVVDYANQQQMLLESYANQQKDFVASGTGSASPINQAAQQSATDGLISIANIDPFTHSPYLRLQKNDVIGCMLDLSVPTIQFTINGKQIFGFFKNFNVHQGGLFHPVVSFSAKVSCRFLFGANQGEQHFRPPVGYSPLVDVLLPNQEVLVEPCFSFGELSKQIVAGPQTTPDSSQQAVLDLVFIPRVIATQNFELSLALESLRDLLAENMHELWCMSRIEDGWTFGDEHDEENQLHPFIAPFSSLPPMGKKYKLELSAQTLKTILGLGYRIGTPQASGAGGDQRGGGVSSSSPAHQHHRVKTYRLPNFPYHQALNDYKPAPLDLSNLELTARMNHLVELLAENMHNIWASEKISMKWTYKKHDPANELDEDYYNGRSCHLLPYKFVDDKIKLKNRQSALETVLTVIAYGYSIEPSPAAAAAASASSNGGRGITSPVSDPTTPQLGELGGGGGGGDAAQPAKQNLLSPSPAQQGDGNAPSSTGADGQAATPSRPMSALSTMLQQTGQQQQQQAGDLHPGHELILQNAPDVGVRHYRAERTYAVQSGRWYYEVEVYTLGHIQIGWSNLNFQSNAPSLGCDENSWAFDCHTGRKVHASNYESFGQITAVGDVIGCMLDLNDRTISYSLNGKLMLDYIGNEMAFGSFELLSGHDSKSTGGGGGPHFASFVPTVSLGVNQRVKLVFGQDVEQLRYFTDYGLQEGYHPFCVNMYKPITLWYNKREPNFVSLEELPTSQVNVDVTRIPPGSDSPPALKIAYKQFESQSERATWEYLRLSLPVTINGELVDESDKIAKMQEIQAQQLKIAYSGQFGALAGVGQGSGALRGQLAGQPALLGPGGARVGGRHPARLEQHMLQSGFSMADVKELQRSYESGGGTSNVANQVGQTQAASSQPRRQLVKTRSVDTADKSGAPPSLVVPSFSEAQRIMADKQSTSVGAIMRRRNTGFGGLLRGVSSSSSLEDVSKQQQQQHQQHQVAVGGATKTTSPKSASFKQRIFGSLRSATRGGSSERQTSGELPGVRAQSLSRSSQLGVPRIAIQDQFGPNGRAESYSNLTASDFGLDRGAPSLGAGRNLARRLSRVGLGGGASNKLLLDANGSGGPTGGSSAAAAAAAVAAATSSPFDVPPFDLQQLDAQMLELIDEYYYGVRIFPGQEPTHVLCGWVTSHFKHESLSSLADIQHAQVVQSTSLLTGQAEICERRECYLLNAGQLQREMRPLTPSDAGAQTSGQSITPSGGPLLSSNSINLDQSASAVSASAAAVVAATSASARSNRGMLVGCHVDTSTGVLTFTVDAKPTKYRFQLEPNTKVYPAIFFQATTVDCLQFELSRTPITLPLSAAILSLTPKHVQPQCPPRLRVQTMRSCSWSRVPNISLRPNSLKLSESKKGWSMLAVDSLALLAVHIPEENRCLDVLELIEHERLQKFHSHTLQLYGALCAQGNHKVAHIVCSHVDQRQLLYAINSDFLSGDLRRGFADLLIALHLEFHAYGRHLTQNEFIVPINKELRQLYAADESSGVEQGGDYALSSLAHSFSRIEFVSIRTEMNMSPAGFDLNSIDPNSSQSGAIYVKLLSTPYFPIHILKRLVFQGLNEAVLKGNLPIRDLPGGSNENLFVPLLKLADRLLLIGCITNQDLGWLLNLIDPETYERNRRFGRETPESGSLEPEILADLSFLAPGANSPSSTWKPTILQQANSLHQAQMGGHQLELAHLSTETTQSNTKRGLLQMRRLDENVKLTICHILHHLLDIQLRHRIESIMAFSVQFVGQLQFDQRRRYDEIKTSNLPSHLTARKTREFRCTPKEQMRYILNFKDSCSTSSALVSASLSSTGCGESSEDDSSSPSSELLRNTLKSLHLSMMKQIKVIIESSGDLDDEQSDDQMGELGEDNETRRTRRLNKRGQRIDANGLMIMSFKKLLSVCRAIKATISTHEQEISRLRAKLESCCTNGYQQVHPGQIELKFVKNVVKTIVKWAEESTIENKQLVRQMFHLLLRCYNGVGELIEALDNSYVIGEKSKRDVVDLLQVLSKVRALLAVQMGAAEEEVMRDCLWTLVNNVVFFQHPDLIRILRVHENVMHVMMNTLSKRSRAQSAASSASLPAQQQQQQDGSGVSASQQQQQQQQAAIAGGSTTARQRAPSVPNYQQQGGGQSVAVNGAQAADQAAQEQDDDISKMVVSCCRFLCFFCRSSAKNQKAMFEHLGFLLENSNILLARPSLRGSTPLDVAYSSLMENHELVLALRESYLEKIAIYLSRCGLQSNQELLDKGYPDIGWDPVEGERYLDFLRFCVWVNGESVEENSNLVIRLLIRRPECLGPALRGEGSGLFAAIKEAISMSERIHAEQQEAKRQQSLEQQQQQQQQQQTSDEQRGDTGESPVVSDETEDEDEINMGSAMLNFYCALVDLLGRCAPDLVTIGQGKHESIRALSILKSLVPLQDLKQALSLRFSLVNPQFCHPDSIGSSVGLMQDNKQFTATAATNFLPNHKQSLVLFLERVYGIEDQETFFALLEEAFLPDMRAATMLERCVPQQAARVLQDTSVSQMALADQQNQALESDSEENSPENEMTLALNRYLGNSAIPLLIRESHYFKNAENYANLLEPTLHTAYRLSKVKILTKGQRESVSDFLIALTREMQPHQLLKLLRKLTVDVAVLNESTTVALRLLTLHYERCSKYYGYSGTAQTSASGVFGTATEEERRLTMVLFTNIFDSLSQMDYDPELFENALPCLNALACALPPDYSLTDSRDFASSSTNKSNGVKANARSQREQQRLAQQLQRQQQQQQNQQNSVGPYVPQPVETRGVELNQELRQLAQRFSEHFHDAWASRKLDRDWTYGEQYNFKSKTHPRLRPYQFLTAHERERYIEPIEEALKALIAMGWSIDRQHEQHSAGQQSSSASARSLSRAADAHSQASSLTSMAVEANRKRDMIQNYNPQPVDTSNLSLSRELQNLAERSAENAHDLWARRAMEDWTARLRINANGGPGEPMRTPIMLHPLMVPYDLLTDKEKRKNRDRSQELLKYILFEGYRIYRADEAAAVATGGQQQLQVPVGMGTQRGRINSRAGAIEDAAALSRSASAANKRRFAYSILDKLIAYTDSVMVKMELLKPSANFSRRSSFRQSDRDVKFFSKVVLPLIERYFTAHREFFLNHYFGATGTSGASAAGQPAGQQSAAGGSSPAASVVQQAAGVESGGSPNLSGVGGGGGSVAARAGGATAAESSDPAATIDGSFSALATASVSSNSASFGTGFSSIQEKEMLATLFCKLAAVLRNKLSVIGPDAKIFVRCMQVLTRALDARSLSERSPDFIKTSMLTYFNKTAQDLSQCVHNLQLKRYNEVRGTTMRTSSSLYHIHLAVLPTLTALFDHLASSESGKYLLMDDIQIASQKILSNMYVLATRIQLAGSHEFSRKELERHRHSYGNCLAAFAAAFPLAFLEPEQLRFNRFSSMYTRQQRQQTARRAQGGAGDELVDLNAQFELPALPLLDELMSLVGKFVQTGKGPSSETAQWRSAPLGLGHIGGRPAAQRGRNAVAVAAAAAALAGGGLNPAGGGAAVAMAGVAGQAHGLGGQPGGQYAAAAAAAQQQVNNMQQPPQQAGVQQQQLAQQQMERAQPRARGPMHQQPQHRMIPADNDLAIIEVIVPILCSYLPFWFMQGPEAPASVRNLGAGSGSTQVGARHLNDLLKDIMHLIRREVGVEETSGTGAHFNWMVAIAAHASQIIIDSPETNLLSDSFLPLSTKIAQRAEQIYHREELMRGYLKSAAEDTTAIEEKIQEEFHLLVRDIYAFYPLLIKYVDFKKSVWLKQRPSGGSGGLFAGLAPLVSGSSSLNGLHQRGQVMSEQQSRQQQQQQQQEEEDEQFNLEQNKPEQLLFQQVATVFDIWSNSQYFRREEQNFISLHEIDNMALIMQASNRPGRTFFQKSDPTQSSSGGRKKKRRQGEKRDRDREIASSLLVVALKRLLPIGMNLFEGRERELVQHVKERFLKKESQSRIEDVVRHQLTQPYKMDPSDEFCWQHYLYSRLGAKHPNCLKRQQSKTQQLEAYESGMFNEHHYQANGLETLEQQQQQPSKLIDARIVSKIVDMARVFYGLHIIDHPNLQQKAGRRSCVSTQRRRVVIACFRMTSLHSLPNHRAINIFLRSYCDTWLLDENLGQEKLIEDLTQTFEQAEMKINGDKNQIPRNDPLSQLIMTLSRQATTEHSGGSQPQTPSVDKLYLQFADIFRTSCGGDEEEEDDDDDEGAEGTASEEEANSAIEIEELEQDEDQQSAREPASSSSSSIHEQEIEKQRLLFQQSRLSDRGVAEMILLYISAFSRHQSASGSASGAPGASGTSSSGSSSGSSGGHHQLNEQTPMILSTLKLGISILRGGNVEVQRRMLKHLKDKKDVGFFTSIQILLNSCSVLDLDAFERNQKAEALGVRSEAVASEKNMYDAQFTCKLFRFFQLLCEGHNLEFQNYLRTQAGNTTTVNVVISTVDYLLRLQESIMDFYWHYSSKDVIDPSGTENFIKAITIAKQVFCTLTESIQGPCPQNQQALAHSRLWHAVGGFLFLFAHMQDKLSRNSSQLNLLIELLDLQKEMVIMMLSMLEGNVVNGTIGKQMVETLVESSSNVEIILKFFDMFLKLPRITSSPNFQEYDRTNSGWISLGDLRRAMEQQKIYTSEETQYLLSCCEPNHDGMIDYREFIDRFHGPAKDIGFNLAVLLTNLAEHITNEPRLQRFLETASTVLNYFEPYLGRIEIMGSSKRIERVYFEIQESTLDQWAKPQIQESKRAFFYSIVTEGDGKEKLEAFVNFCEDTIFEMQHASNILGEDEEPTPTKADKYPFEGAESSSSSSSSQAGARQSSASGGGSSGGGGGRGSLRSNVSGSQASPGNCGSIDRAILWQLTKGSFMLVFGLLMVVLNSLRPSKLRHRWWQLRRMTYSQMARVWFRWTLGLWIGTAKWTFSSIGLMLHFIFRIMTDESHLTTSANGASSNELGQVEQLARKRVVLVAPQVAQAVMPLAYAPEVLEPTRASDRQQAEQSQQHRSSSLGQQQSSGSQAGHVASSNARTELVSAPSVMRASVAEVGHRQPTQQQKQPQVAQSKQDPNEAPKSEVQNQLQQSSKAQLLRARGTEEMVVDQGAFMVNDFDLSDGSDKLLAQSGGGGSGGGGGGQRERKSRSLLAKFASLTNYNHVIISFLARNFYRLKLLALITAFIINFILLFYKVSVWSSEAMESSAHESSFLSVMTRRTLGELDQGINSGDNDAAALAASTSRRLDEIEAKIQAGFAHFERTYGRKRHEFDTLDEGGNEAPSQVLLDDEDTPIVEDEPAKGVNDTKGTKNYEDEGDDDDDDDEGAATKHKEDGEEEEQKDGEKYEDNDDEEDLTEWVVMEEKYYYLQSILCFLASIHSLFSLCMLIAYYHLKVPLVIFKREKELARKLEFDGVYITEEPDSDDWWKGHWDRLVISARSFPVNYWDKFVKKRVREKYREQCDYESLTDLLGMGGDRRLMGAAGKRGSRCSSATMSRPLALFNWLSGGTLLQVDWRYQLWKAGVTLTDQSFQYQLLYLVFSLAGHFNYFFFAAHLLDVAVGFKKLQTILQSVTHNGKQVVLTVMLLTIIVYIYTVIAFNFFRKFYVQGDDSGGDQKCHSMMTCFVYHLYQGVRAGGGIGDVIEAPDGDDYEVYRIIFDITFFFFVIIILLAIIQGLIIDAFGELRDQLLTVASDMESNCFICGIGKDVLDKVPRGFDTHVQKEHNLANYMFFLMHLINKADTDYTGQETYVWELYQRRCWDFFPVGECFRTQSEEEADAKSQAKD